MAFFLLSVLIGFGLLAFTKNARSDGRPAGVPFRVRVGPRRIQRAGEANGTRPGGPGKKRHECRPSPKQPSQTLSAKRAGLADFLPGVFAGSLTSPFIGEPLGKFRKPLAEWSVVPSARVGDRAWISGWYKNETKRRIPKVHKWIGPWAARV